MAKESFNPVHDEFVAEHGHQLTQLNQAVEDFLRHYQAENRYYRIDHATGVYWQSYDPSSKFTERQLRLDRITVSVTDSDSTKLTLRFFVDPSSYLDMVNSVICLQNIKQSLESDGFVEESTLDDVRSLLVWSINTKNHHISHLLSGISIAIV